MNTTFPVRAAVSFRTAAALSAAYRRAAILTAACFMIAAFALAAASAAPSPIQIVASPCFHGIAPRGTVPIAITLHSTGVNVDNGVVTVQFDGYQDSFHTYNYPVPLPSGSTKRLIAYPTGSADKVVVTYTGSFSGGSVSVPIEFSNYAEGQQVALISDQYGGLAALKRATITSPEEYQSGRGGGMYNDAYAAPEDAPERATGYRSLSRLILAQGAEKMNADQWTAIRRWVMSGGSLILFGGPSSSYLSAPDMAPLIPIENVHQAAVAAIPDIGLGSGIVPPGPFAVTTGAPKPGAMVLRAADGVPLIVKQRYGLGVVTLIGFDPLDKPIRGWKDEPNLLLKLMEFAHPSIGADAVWSMAMQPNEENSYGSSYPGFSSPAIDPFQVKLPPLTQIGWLFGAYVIAVVPVTYFLLKRLKRLEWAWISSPIISLAFAYVFYLFTAQLYEAGMSTRTSGIIVSAAGAHDAQFIGRSEVFFPHGGNYDIHIKQAETLEMSPVEDESGGYYYRSRSSSTGDQSMQTDDDSNAVRAPAFGVSNLAFRRFYHAQPVDWGNGVSGKLVTDGNGKIEGTVTNSTDQDFDNASVLNLNGRTAFDIGVIKAGETKTLGASKLGDATFGQEYVQRLLQYGTDKQTEVQGTALFVAARSGNGLGPMKLGNYVGQSSSVAVMVSIPVKGP